MIITNKFVTVLHMHDILFEQKITRRQFLLISFSLIIGVLGLKRFLKNDSPTQKAKTPFSHGTFGGR